MTYQIRQATLGDAQIIAELNCRLASESEQKTLNPDKVLPGVCALLQDEHKGIYHLACDEQGQPVGQVMYTYEWSDWRNGWFWWIQSVYVVPEHRGRGVFRRIYQHLRQQASIQGNVIGFRLYVEENNTSAHEVYRRSGFTRPGYFVLEHLT
ncbi:MAG TPA: GNAT family N-acetyltransferase [Gemmatales bacterium]|nr:GNAT family N-acetyltransferase [Gemmatales bacterium]